VPSHAHHAIQIVIALDGCVAICDKDDGWRESRGIVVRPDAEHSFDCNGALGVMVFVDPESSEGAWLSASLRQDITIVPDTRLDSIVPELREFAEQPDETEDVAALLRGCVQGLRPGLAPTRRFDSRVTTVLNAIQESDDLRMSLDKVCRRPALPTCSKTRSVFRSAGTCCGAN
jgi:AraC family transcriptional regulator